MDKSMVHQLSPLVRSNVQYSRSSFIHTVYETDFNELRKSRIQNLPNYRKEDLSGKLNFVVVFQGIQIERLSVEVETLRVKIKDYERQLRNYLNYQVQIRQLTEKCHSYEMQRQDHQEGMQKMHKICQQLYNQLEEMRSRYADIDLSLKEKYRLEKQRSDMLLTEIQKWKARYNASETSKAKQLQDMRMMLQNQRKSILQRQIRELSVKHESQRSMLQSELRKLRENIENRNNQLIRTRQQLQESRIRQSELHQYEGQLEEYENKLMLMAQQNMRLNEQLRKKKQEIEQLKNIERNLEKKLQTFSKLQQQFSLISNRLQSQESELHQWNQKYSRLEAENNRNLILSNKAQQYERLLDSSAQEMEKMNSIIREKITQIDKHKTINQRILIQLQEAKATQSRLSQYEDIVRQISLENQQLNAQNKTRLEEIQGWKHKYQQIQEKIHLSTQTQNQCKNLKEKLSVETATRAKLSQTISYLEKQLAKTAQVQQNLIKQRGLNKDLQRQIQRLNTSIRNLSAQNNDYVKKTQALESELKENTGFLEELQQYKRKINMMTKQLDRINGFIHEKIQQIKHLKENYNSVNINTTRYRQIEEQFVASIQQTQKLLLRLDENRRQNECLNEKLLNAEFKTKKLQEQIYSNNEEKDKLISIVSQKKSQLEDLMTRINDADKKIYTLQGIQQQFKSSKNSYSQLEQRYKELENKYQKQTKRTQNLSQQIEKLNSQISKLKTESNFTKQFISQFINIKTLSQEKDRLLISLIQRIAFMQKSLKSLKQQNNKNSKNMVQQHEKWKKLNSNLEVIFNFMEKFHQLQQKFDDLSDENLKLESSVNMINLELAESEYVIDNSFKKYSDPRIIINSPKDSIIHQKGLMDSTFLIQKSRIQDEYIQVHRVEPHQIISSITGSPNNKLATIDQNYSYESSIKKIQPVSPTRKDNYCQSQVRQLYGNGFPSSSSFFQSNMQRFGDHVSPRQVHYTTKALRPGSNQQSTTTYSYTSSFETPKYSNNYKISNPTNDQSKMNHLNNYKNNGSNISNATYTTSYTKSQQGSSYVDRKDRQVNGFIKQANKYSDASPDVKTDSKHKNSDGISKIAPSRF